MRNTNTKDLGTGISNRETPEEEAAERAEFPPIQPLDEGAERAPKVEGAFGKDGKPAPEDQAGSSHPARAKQD
jgi:hypothetical protein